MVKLKTCDFVIINKERIALSETMCSFKDVEQYANARVLEELEQIEKGFTFFLHPVAYDYIRKRIKKLKEVKP